MGKVEWILCPVCGSKTRNKVKIGYCSEKLSSLLPKMQAGNIDRSEEFASNSHHRARHIRCRADEHVRNHSLSAFLFTEP